MSLDLDYRYINRHRGSYRDFLTRYQCAAIEARAAGGGSYQRFCDDLLKYISDERNLMAAMAYLSRFGGAAPGPSGDTWADWPTANRWTLVRELRNRLRENRHVRGPLKPCPIQKHPGSRAKRTIWLADIPDRVVARGAAQILGPLLRSVADPLSFCWPQRGAQSALAHVQRRLTVENRTAWIIEDMRDAFDRVPRARLAQILHHYVPNQAVCDLVMNLAERPGKHGILQGSSVSPMLFDVYAQHFIHRPWRREKRRPPLLRYLDDVLIACRPDEDVGAYYRELLSYFSVAGMEPKHGPDKAMIDLRYQTAIWLGYRLCWRRDTLRITPKLFSPNEPENDPGQHAFVVQKFLRLHDRPDGWRYVNSLIRSLVAHLAPTLPFVNPRAVYEQIAAAAREAAFEEILSYGEVHEFWQRGYERWLKRLEDDK